MNPIIQLKKELILLTLLLSIMITGFSQQLVLSGKITFERKENLHKQFTGNDNWSEEYIKRIPKYRVDLFQLTFNTHQSLYKILEEAEGPFSNWWRTAAFNTVSLDLDKNRYKAQKTIYERDYQIEDSIPQYQWKLLGEYREIAGYNCRKASTIVMDSLYIIVFFSDEIPVSAGPESFTGLPGMILGVVIPRLNYTYFATKIETQIVPEADFTVKPGKFKKTTLKDYSVELKKALSDWGEEATKTLWKANL